MKMSKAEYEELIRKKPSLRPTEEIKKDLELMGFTCKPTEVIKSQNTHKDCVEAAQEMGKYYESLNSKEQREFNEKLGMTSPWLSVLNGSKEDLESKGVLVPIVQEKPVKSPRTLKFTIFGDPVGKPRQTRSDKWKKRPCVMRYREWADNARASVPKDINLEIYREISFVAHIGFPGSYSKKRMDLLERSPHLQKPDIDNIAKALLDSLFPEDKFIWKFSGEKRWSDEKGCRIEVELK